jgi:transcriptional regulator with XRE-family HTH domain
MPAVIANELKKLGIGKKIATLRTAKGVSVDDLAAKLRVSKVLLSQIEGEVVPPTIATLLNIAKLLGVEIDHFFTDAEDAGKIEITRADERLAVHHDEAPAGESGLNYSYESLAFRLAHKHMEPFFVVFDSEKPTAEALSHDGEEFMFVLEGEVEFIAGGNPVRLHAGDALYFYAGVPHAIRGVGARSARAIVVMYPYSH